MSFQSSVSSKLPLVGSPSSGDYATMAAVLVAATVSQPGFGGRYLNVLNFTGLRGPMGEILENGARIGIKGVKYSTTVAHAIVAVIVFYVAQWGLGKVLSGTGKGLIADAAAVPMKAAAAAQQAASSAGQAVSNAVSGDAASVDAMRRRRLAAARQRVAAVSAQRRRNGSLRGQKTGGAGGFLSKR